MQYEKKYFGNGQGNFDDVDFILLPNQWVNLENARIGSTDKGVIGTVESVGSNLQVVSDNPAYTCIGNCVDEENQCILLFLVNNEDHDFDLIAWYELSTQTYFHVLVSYQVIGGLNFNKDNIIHSAVVVNGMLYWTDFLNQPRRLNIKAAIEMNHSGTFPDVAPYTVPLTAEVITIIRKPPVYPLTLEKIEDNALETNQIKNNAFRFTYQYVYRDGEKSTLAPHSLLAPYNYPNETFNAINVNIPLSEKPDQDTQLINAIVIYVDGEQGYIIKTWDKANATDAAEIAAHVAGTSPLTFEFANDSVGEAIDNATLIKPYDTVPLLSETLEQGTNRLFLGRNLLGYDTPVTSGLTAEIVSSGGGGTITGQWRYVLVYYNFCC
jgi:hypothetical protein